MLVRHPTAGQQVATKHTRHDIRERPQGRLNLRHGARILRDEVSVDVKIGANLAERGAGNREGRHGGWLCWLGDWLRECRTEEQNRTEKVYEGGECVRY